MLEIKNKDYGILDRGIPTEIPVSVIDVSGKPIDISNQKIFFTIKSNQFDFDRDDRFAFVNKEYIVPKDNNCEVTNHFTITLTAEDMDFAPGEYYFDIIIGGWRVVNTTFTLVGGPTNRNILQQNEGQFDSIGRPIQIIAKPNKPIIIVTDFNPFLSDIKEQLREELINEINKKYLPYEVRET